MFNITQTCLTLLSVSCLLATAVIAHEGATGVVKERMDAMKAMGRNAETIGSMIKGETSFDSGAAQLAAKAIATESGSALLAHFPEGSLHPPSEALPTIWTQWPDFEELADELQIQARLLATKAATLEGVTPAFVGMGRTCSACHERFRAEN